MEKCVRCVQKHVAQAYVLMCEEPDYPLHRLIAIGNLAEAERECAEDDLRIVIRECRKALEEGAGSDVVYAILSEVD